MSFLHRLRYLFGLEQEPGSHAYHMDAELQFRIAALARLEKRSIKETTEKLLSQGLNQQYASDEIWQHWLSLSRREQHVAALASLGRTNAEIAGYLGVSVETVKTHIRNILIKFKINSRKQLELMLGGWNFEELLPPDLGDTGE